MNITDHKLDGARYDQTAHIEEPESRFEDRACLQRVMARVKAKQSAREAAS